MNAIWPDLGQQKLHFVTGKGGVGKSTVAQLLAQEFARQGHDTLLVEMNHLSYFARVFSRPVGHTPLSVGPHLALANWQVEECLREYVLHYLKLEKLFDIFFRNKIMRAFIDIAPGLTEISLLGKITSGLRKIGPPLNFDRIVIDCFATGDALAFFRAPQGLAAAVNVGPMGEQSRAIDAVLKDQRLSCYWAVTSLEELPVVETLELVKGLKDDLGVETKIIANRVLPQLHEPSKIPTGFLGEFIKDIGTRMRHQNAWREQFSLFQQKISVELPFVYQSDPQAIVTELQRGLR